MKGKSVIFRGLAAVMGFILLVSVTASTLTFQYANIINNALGVSSTKVVESEDAEAEAAIYFENDYGYDDDALVDVNIDAAAANVEIAEEGITLLANEGEALPISSDSRVTVFGNAAVNSSLYSTSTESYLGYIDLVTALENEFGEDNVNSTLCTEVYSQLSSSGVSSVSEADIEDVKAYEDTWAEDYNDAAIVVIGRTAGEGNDIQMYSDNETYDDGSARRMLDLSVNEQALIEYLVAQKEAGVFDKIIAIITSEYQMELDWIEDYGIDAALMVGELGTFGCTAIAEVLDGTVNPSGHLVDTYAADSTSAPATTYAGVENTQVWTNSDEVIATVTDVNEANGRHIINYVIYAEGIYVGYKYYETRYEDAVMGTGNADGAAGSTTDGDWNYEDEMVYTFGYGLSYTTFEQTIDSVTWDEESSSYIVSVTVTNTGDVAGKDVVEVYAQTPYGDYEKENLVEKASVDLMGYNKTDELEPGESQTLEITVPEYFLASYDTYGAGTYILSEGDYYLAIGNDAHDALNNILAAKGYTTADGMTADGDASKTYTWNQAELDAETYSTSVYTDAEVTNQFDHADINYYDYDFTYLTRQDWEGTYPEEAVQLEATDEVMADLSNYDYEMPEDAPSVDDFTQGVDNGLTLVDMMDVDFDDELWDDFIDQFTIEELANLMVDSRSTQVVEELDVPGNSRIDDDTTAGGQFKWISQCLTSRTWNTDMAELRGYYSGLIAQLNGYDEIWFGAGNLHRTPFGGRARQYYSEDATISYYTGYYEAQSMQATGVTMCAKHFATNDQETNREGLCTFSNEQALREIYLRAFEGSFAGGALSTMCALNRIGTRLAKNDESLITTVLRDEWGFEGHVTSDGYVDAPYFNNYREELTAGMDYGCIDTSGNTGAGIYKYITEDNDGYLLSCLRLAAKRNLYVMAHSASMNGLGNGSSVVSVVPAWELALMLTSLISLIGLVIFTVLALVSSRHRKVPADAGAYR